MEQTYPPLSLESRRIPLLKKVELRFSNREEPVSEVGINVSMTGLFVRSSAPQPADSIASFRFRLQEGSEPIGGLAEVVWVRKEEAGPYKPAGMGMRFLRIDGDGRERLRSVVEAMITETEAPPELRDLRSVVEETLEGILGIEAEEPPQPVRRSAPPSFRAKEARTVVSRRADRPWWRRLAWVPLVLLLVGGGALVGWKVLDEGSPGKLGTWWWAVDDQDSGPSTPDQAGDEIPEPTLEAAAEGDPAEGDPAEASTSDADVVPRDEGISIDQELASGAEAVVLAWAEAWSAQRVDDYLAFYSPSFRPADGSSRFRWEAQRRNRVRAPRSLQVQVQEMETTLVPPDGAWVQFQQSYRSDTFSDTVLKTLSLALEDGRWRIVEERVDT